MKLSLEIPTAYLEDWSPLTDLNFALAHKVLESDRYCEFYANSSKDTILDNSMHELGKPLSPAELLEAAKRCKAKYVIAPDELKKPKENLEWFKQTHRLLGDQFEIAVVMCGNSPSERALFLDAVRHSDLLCLPYREPRVEWFFEQRHRIYHGWYNSIHLLGVNDLQEFDRWPHDETRFWSIDTRKPIKWGIQKQRMDNLKTLRGAGSLTSNISCDDVRELNCSQVEAVLWNIAYLRKAMEV